MVCRKARTHNNVLVTIRSIVSRSRRLFAFGRRSQISAGLTDDQLLSLLASSLRTTQSPESWLSLVRTVSQLPCSFDRSIFMIQPLTPQNPKSSSPEPMLELTKQLAAKLESPKPIRYLPWEQ